MDDLETILFAAAAIVLVATFFLVTIAAGVDLTRFLARTPALRSEADMDDFRRVAGRNMIAALLLIGLAAAAALVVTGAAVLGYFELFPLLIALASTTVLSTLASFWTKRLETRAKQIPVADEWLLEERDHVVHVWRTHMLPDW